MKSIVLIIPYFGKFRNDFYFWLKSVEFNKTIDFLIVTDQELLYIPSNVRVLKSSLKDIEQLAKEKIWGGCILEKPYKLCDYKPTYGLLFKEYVESYDFWGYCDTDLVFGDIRSFITDDILEKFDRVLTNGHLTLMRNTNFANNYFREVTTQNYKDVFTKDKAFCFDEMQGTSGYMLQHHPDRVYHNTSLFLDVERYIYYFTSAYGHTEEKNVKNMMASFKDGKLYRYYEKGGEIVKEEILYIHFQKRYMSVCTTPSNQFSMVPNMFIDYVEGVTHEYLRWHIREGRIWTYLQRAIGKIYKFMGITPRHTLLTVRPI